MDTEELSAREAIRELVASYNHLGDRGRVAEMTELFAADAELDAFGELFRGRDEIGGFYRGIVEGSASEPTRGFVRHHISNVTITVTGPAEAHGASYWAVIADGGPSSSGRYRDSYRRDPDGAWRFASRTIRADPWGTFA